MINSLKNAKLSISKIHFDLAGKISLQLEDGRIIIVPLRYFPQIQKMPLEKRKKYTIVDDRTVLFFHSNLIYHLEDFMGLESRWREG